jgi:hypothetical protein
LRQLRNLLDALGDNKWHEIGKVANTLGVSEKHLKETASFLSSAGILQYDDERGLIKIKENWKTLLISEENYETKGLDKTAIGTIILPPEKTVTIQNTNITNLTNQTLELELKINTKLREIAINTIK